MVAQKYPNGYSGSRRIQNTETFSRWLRSLRDTRGKARVLMRLKALQFGHLGDCRSLGGGLHELRIFVGPGYRIYLAYRHEAVVVLLCGGDKSSQPRDIVRARQLLAELE